MVFPTSETGIPTGPIDIAMSGLATSAFETGTGIGTGIAIWTATAIGTGIATGIETAIGIWIATAFLTTGIAIGIGTVCRTGGTAIRMTAGAGRQLLSYR